ncbi:MAG: DegV family protein [Oscillospiraceae bacterium]|jgi:DegV family protein with EDD domain|nr:DegV family protein [Oscillospiraceae bacterium]
MKVKITADSTCDLPQDIIEKYNIGITPLYIIMDEKPYKDRLEITVTDMFEYVESGKGMTRSNAINISEYQEYFTEWLKECDAIVHISISNHFSACNQSARIAAEDFDNVYIVDSLNLSTGSGLLVLDAAIMAKEGKTPEQIVERLEELVPKVEASFVISTLKYLRLGGRCSSLAALGANILKLNPCIGVIDGKMDVVKKYRGVFDKIILQYVDDRLNASRDDIDTRRIFITYSEGTSEAIVKSVIEKIKSLRDFDEIICSEAGCVISNHCGPKCLGILFYRK